MRAAVPPVPGVQLQVAIAATLVLEQPRAPTASVRHLITVALQLISVITLIIIATLTPPRLNFIHKYIYNNRNRNAVSLSLSHEISY